MMVEGYGIGFNAGGHGGRGRGVMPYGVAESNLLAVKLVYK